MQKEPLTYDEILQEVTNRKKVIWLKVNWARFDALFVCPDLRTHIGRTIFRLAIESALAKGYIHPAPKVFCPNRIEHKRVVVGY